MIVYRPKPSRSPRTHAPNVATLSVVAAQPLTLPRRPPGAPWRRMMQIMLPWGKP